MITRLFNEILMRIFVDNFAVSAAIIVSLTVMLIMRRVSKLNIPLALAIPTWYLIVVTGVVVFLYLLIDFFSHDQGMDRVASIPLILGTSPLFISLLIVIFFYPSVNK